MAFNDAHCPKCGQRISWMGEVKDQPPCHHCGHRVPAEDLEETERKLDEMRKKIFEEMDAEE